MPVPVYQMIRDKVGRPLNVTELSRGTAADRVMLRQAADEALARNVGHLGWAYTRIVWTEARGRRR